MNKDCEIQTELIGKFGGYRKMDSFTLATIVQIGTWEFCEKFLNMHNDPKGRQFDQMTQAARSGRTNIIEGSERAGTSKTTEMRLTDVARASLAELKGDYEFWLLCQKKVPWNNSCDLAKEIYHVKLDTNPPGLKDGLHYSGVYLLAQYDKFDKWLSSDDSYVAANTMIVLINRAVHLLARQINSQSEKFVNEGGFYERAKTERLKKINNNTTDVVVCPECGKPMRKRIARIGKNEGKEFWGCSGYPECKVTKEIDE